MGWLLWRGPSQLDPDVEIGMIATRPGTNRQTGDMHTIWYMRLDQAPHDAVKNGVDAAICGTCPRRPAAYKANGVARCYVVPHQAPRAVLKATDLDRAMLSEWHAHVKTQRARFRPVLLRLGGYGDPTSVPLEVTIDVLRGVQSHTGYTAQWREHPEYMAYLMASVTSVEEAFEAQELGWRTFRASPGTAAIPRAELNERWCPSVTHARMACDLCRQCSGGRGVSFTVPEHGYGKKSKAEAYRALMATTTGEP